MVILNCLSFKIFTVLLLATAVARACDVGEAVSDSAGTRSVPADSSSFSLPVHRPEHPSFLRRLGEDFILQATAPFTMNAQQAAHVGAGVGITTGLIVLDEPIDREFRHLKTNHSVIRTTSPILTDFGGTSGILTGVVYAGYSVIWDDEDAKETSLLLTEALITSGVWTRLGKMLAGRERPSAAYEFSHEAGGKWSGPGGSIEKKSNESVAKYDAFPSGHTATAFAIATVFAKRYSESSYIPILSYSLATIVGITRMIEHTHWASDVFAGACIGYLCGDQVVSHFEKTDTAVQDVDPTKKTVKISMGILNDAPALQLAIGF